MPTAPAPLPSRTRFVLEGISKTPVREALRTQAGTGPVVISEHRGVTVRRVDARMAREVHEVRLLLEILRLALAGDADGAASALRAHVASFVRRAFPEAEAVPDRGAFPEEGRER